MEEGNFNYAYFIVDNYLRKYKNKPPFFIVFEKDTTDIIREKTKTDSLGLGCPTESDIYTFKNCIEFINRLKWFDRCKLFPKNCTYTDFPKITIEDRRYNYTCPRYIQYPVNSTSNTQYYTIHIDEEKNNDFSELFSVNLLFDDLPKLCDRKDEDIGKSAFSYFFELEYVLYDKLIDLEVYRRLKKQIEDNLQEAPLATDKSSLLQWIQTRDPKNNFIDLNNEFLDLEKVQTYISQFTETYLKTSYDDPYKDVMLMLNNVIAIYSNHGSHILVKKTRLLPGQDKLESVIEFWSIDNVKQILANCTVTLYTESKNPKNPYTTFKTNWFKLWMMSVYRAQVTDMAFKPYRIDEVDNSRKYLDFQDSTDQLRRINTFTGYFWTIQECEECFDSEDGKISIKYFEKMIFEGFCARDEICYNYFMNWMSFILQYPNKKTKVAIILKTQKGVGKNTLGKIFKKFFGKHALIINSQYLTDRFNDFMIQKKIIFADEIDDQKKSIVTQILQNYISEEEVSVEPKYQPRKIETNLTEFILATNDDLSWMRFSDDNRRYFVLEGEFWTQEKLLKWRSEMDIIYENLLGDPLEIGIKAVFYMLFKRDISRFEPRKNIPKTEFMCRLIENSLPEVIQWWKSVLERRQLKNNDIANTPIQNSYINWTDFYGMMNSDVDYLKSSGKGKITVKNADFRTAMIKVVSFRDYSEKQSSFVFNPWEDQISKWNEMYPSVPLQGKFGQITSVNPRMITHQTTINSIPKDRIVSKYTSQEKDYLIYRLKEKLLELEVDVICKPSCTEEVPNGNFINFVTITNDDDDDDNNSSQTNKRRRLN